jgi:hypothetical protein
VTYRLKHGDRVRVRQRSTDDWTDAAVAVASDKQPASVMLLLDGPVRAGGGVVSNGLPLTIDYEKETVTGLFGGEYEIEVRSEQATYCESEESAK